MHPSHMSARPAVALYKFWDTVLTHTGQDRLEFGQRGWSLIRETGDSIGFGQYRSHFVVDAKGRFHLDKMHGTYRRNVIAQHVPFLGWSYTHSRYQWLVDFNAPTNLYHWRTTNLADWQNPHHYVSEDLLGCRTYYQTNRWCVLKKVDGEFRIQLAHDQTAPDRHGEYNERLQAELPAARKQWCRYEQIVEQRYARARRNHLGEAANEMSVRTPTMLIGNQPLPTDVAVERLLALLEVDQPAKTTPLKRPKEARDGSNNMAPAHTL